MRMKLIAWVMMMAIALSGMTALAQEEEMGYVSDFAQGEDGWYARSMGTAKVYVTEEKTLKIEGRTDNWNSPGRDFLLQQGTTYQLSVEVKQEQADAAKFMISVAHTAGGTESYENLAFGTAKKGEWTTLTGSYMAGPYDKFVLYVETTGAPELDFEIRNFKAEGEMAKPVEVPDIPSLKEVYADRFDFGTAVTYFESTNKQKMNFYASQFNIMTPGNEMKPDSLLDVTLSKIKSIQDDTAVAVKFNAVRPLLDYAQANGIKVHGHVLVWHNQTPKEFFHEHYNPNLPLVTREVMLARLDNYVKQIMEYLDEKYPGVVVSWDVVNEAVDDQSGKLRESPWLDVVGEDYIERAFEIARKHAPEGVLLFYNDYNTAILVKQNGILEVLEKLTAEGNIDGYGFQMHHDIGFPSISQIDLSLQRVAATGLLMRVSELDITVPDNSEASFERQGRMYGQIMKLLEAYGEQMIAVQVWGVSDDLSWRAAQYPLLFDGELQPKPAFWAVVEP